MASLDDEAYRDIYKIFAERDAKKKEKQNQSNVTSVNDNSNISNKYTRRVDQAYESSRRENTKSTRTNNFWNQKITVKTAAIASAILIVVTATVGGLMSNGLKNANNKYGTGKYYAETGYSDEVADTVWSRNDKNGHVYGYNHSTLAEIAENFKFDNSVINDEDLALYGIFCALGGCSGMNINYNMNEVVARTDGLKGNDKTHYGSFSTYLVAKGFTDKDGNANMKKYDKEMSEIVSNMREQEKFAEKHNMGGK